MTGSPTSLERDRRFGPSPRDRTMAKETGATSALTIFARFLRFGLLAWGGPVAQIAMIKRELVEEEKWISPSRFNRLLAVYQVLPGPEAHELCVHLRDDEGRPAGRRACRARASCCPGLLLVLGLAWLYRQLDLQQPLLRPSSWASRSASSR